MVFRVWHKGEEKWLSSYLGFAITDTGQLLIEGHFGDEAILDEVKSDEFIVSKSIGLKDKNGLDIFEGDIIKYEVRNNKFAFGGDWEGKIRGIGKIEYHFAGYFISDMDDESSGLYSVSEFLTRWDECEFEVIGNIYYGVEDE